MHASGAAALAENSQPQIQSRPLVRKLTFPPAGVRYVALPSSSGPPEHPRGQAASTRALSVAGPLLFAVLEMIDNEIFADRDDANGPNEKAANWAALRSRCCRRLNRRQWGQIRRRARSVNFRFKISRFIHESGGYLGVLGCLGDPKQDRRLTHEVLLSDH
jgi:hypothetical protein